MNRGNRPAREEQEEVEEARREEEEEDRRELEETLGKSIEGNIGKKKLQKLQDKAEKKKQREAQYERVGLVGGGDSDPDCCDDGFHSAGGAPLFRIWSSGQPGSLNTRSPGLRGLRVLGTLGAFLSLSVASPFRGWGPGEGYGNAGAR